MNLIIECVGLLIVLKNNIFLSLSKRHAQVINDPHLVGRKGLLLKEAPCHLERPLQLFQVDLTVDMRQFTSGKTKMAFKYGING